MTIPKTFKQEFNALMGDYALTNRSDEIRLELCSLIETAYCGDLIDRNEYHSALAYIS